MVRKADVGRKSANISEQEVTLAGITDQAVGGSTVHGKADEKSCVGFNAIDSSPPETLSQVTQQVPAQGPPSAQHEYARLVRQ